MANIDARAPFFPNSRTAQRAKTAQAQHSSAIKRNSADRFKQIQNMTGKDARVSIPDAVRDFSRIRKAVDSAPEIDNSAKIAKLKSQIASGQYNINYDAVADKMLQSEF